MNYNIMTCISYILESERSNFEEWVSSDTELSEIAENFLSLDEVEGVDLDEDTINFLKDSNHIYASAVLAINGL